MTPFVSVIIPVYNAEKFLRECLDSVVNQTLREIEIICVDDGSTDSSPAVLAEYAARDSRVRVLTQENSGVGPARNAGIRAARGEFVAFLDPDDLLPDASVYEALYFYAKENRVRVCGGGVCSLANDGKRYFPDASWGANVDQAFPREGFMRFADWQFDYGFYRYIFERALLLDDEIFFPPYIRYQDPPFCARALEAAGTFYAIRRPTYVFRDWHTPDYTDRRRVCDQLRGIRDQLKFSRERDYAKLHWLQLHRLFEEFKPHVLDAVEREKNGDDVPADQSAIALLKEIDAQADMRLARRYKPDALYYSVDAEFLHPEIKVSVIIPVYNVEKYLRQCLDSVVNQTLKDIEIICVDDGSTDSSLRILEEYAAKDPRIRILRQQNLFAGVARNNGMKIARGKYLSFLDSDDFFALDMFEKMVARAEATGAEICICDFEAFYGDCSKANWTKRVGTEKFRSQNTFSASECFKSLPMDCLAFNPWNKIFRRKFIEELGNEFLATRSSNDLTFVCFALASAERMTISPNTFVFYRRVSEGSISSSRGKHQKMNLEAWRVLRERMKSARLDEKFRDSLIAGQCASHAYELSLNPSLEFLYEVYASFPDIPYEKRVDMEKRAFSKIISTPDSPLVSVVVPVYNVEKSLRECLDSVVNQTLKEIEIICVDDGSTDGSHAILEEYAAKDSRIRVIRQNNLGTSQTRKNGVAASRGAFLMFLDGDDEFVSTACEKAHSAASRSGADIVQFGTEIVNVAGVPHERIAMNEKMLEPFSGKIDCENLVEACWVKNKFSGNLWNKIFRGDLVRKAFDCVEDGYFRRAEDWYAFFIIAYLSRSYFGIADKLYRYNFGIGVIGGNKLTMKKFDALLSQKKVFEALKSFLGKRGDGKHYQNSLETIRTIFLGQCLHAWQSKLSKEDAVGAFPKLIDTWGFEEVLVSFAKSKWDSYVDFSETSASAFILNVREERKRIKTVAFYYRCIANGGAQRVVADLCNRFAEKKNEKGDYAFNVVCITDSEFWGVKGDYPLSARVARTYLPAFAKSSREKYRDRFHAWHEIISEHEIDVVVSGLWTEPVTFWDALCVKGHPRSPYFLTHSHSYNAIPYLWGETSPKRIDALYRVCDGAVALSDCDRRHIEKINPHVRAIVNPLAFDPRKVGESSREPNTIVWCGRISGEKRPLDTVRMMRKVVAEIPDAKLRLVGGGDESLMRATADLVRELGLEKNVELVGFTHDVAAYYSKASVFVLSAEYEGFSLTFGEAMAHGIPIVSYDMPWLTFMRDGRGIIPVERLNPDAIAREVVRLLKNPAEARELGLRGREHIIEINDVDIVAEWENLFDEIAGVPVKKREFSSKECAELDAINERFVEVFRRVREEKRRGQSSIRVDSREPAGEASEGRGGGNVVFPLPRFLVRLGALFILNKAARKRWRERHMDLTPKDGIDVNAHPELRRDSELKRFAVRAASLFIFSKKKRKAFRAKHLNLRPRDGVDVRALSSKELSRLREAKRSRSTLWRVFDALVPATRGKIAHTERHLRRAAEEQTRILIDELRRMHDENRRAFDESRRVVDENRRTLGAVRAELKTVRERAEALSRELAASKTELKDRTLATERALRAELSATREALTLKTLAAKHAVLDAESNLQARLGEVLESLNAARSEFAQTAAETVHAVNARADALPRMFEEALARNAESTKSALLAAKTELCTSVESAEKQLQEALSETGGALAREQEKAAAQTNASLAALSESVPESEARVLAAVDAAKSALGTGKIDKIAKTSTRVEAWMNYCLLCDAFPEFRERLRERNPLASREIFDELFRTGADSPRIVDYRNWQAAQIRSAFAYKNAAYYERVPAEARERELKLWFKLRTGRDLDLKHPKTFNEKIQWLKLYDVSPLKTRLADKFEVREWIREKIGEKYLTPLIGVYDTFDEIDFDRLPDKFVLKTTHGSGYNIVVKDKSRFDKADAKKKFDDWLSRKFEYQAGFEMHYAGMKPRIIAEEFLDIDESGFYEWQAFCFNGEAKFFLVIVGGAHDSTPGKRFYYSPKWEKLPFTSLARELPEGAIPCPDNFAELAECVKKLCDGFLHVRVDFYRLRDGNWKFGEMTFSTASGLWAVYPEEYDRVVGDMLTLPAEGNPEK